MSSESVPFNHTNMIYLDYNATCPIDKEVYEAMVPYLTNHFGNASSRNFFGKQPKIALEQARKSIANLINVEDEKSVIFTSGSTEAINHIFRVSAHKQRDKGYGDHIICSQIEHPAVIQTVKYLQRKHKFKVTYLKPDKYGMILPKELEKALTPSTILVSIMHANNEIGTINPLKNLCATTKAYDKKILFFSDTSQSVGKLHVYPKEWNLDFITVAGHKIYAPKGMNMCNLTSHQKVFGIGAMWINPKILNECNVYGADNDEFNLLFGAPQEFGLRPGTENIPYCVGMGKAAEQSIVSLKSDHMATIRYLRDLLYSEIMANIPHKYHELVRVNGHPYIKLANTLSISFGFLRNVQITDKIFKYIACSTGAACHSGNVKLSYVLEACGVSMNYGMGTLRLCIGRYTTEKDVVLGAKIIASAVTELYDKSRFAKL